MHYGFEDLELFGCLKVLDRLPFDTFKGNLKRAYRTKFQWRSLYIVQQLELWILKGKRDGEGPMKCVVWSPRSSKAEKNINIARQMQHSSAWCDN